MRQLTIVTVTYNSASVLPKLLHALGNVDADIIVVDNCSHDDTVAQAREFPNVRIIESGNVGYGAGANKGFHEATTPYVMLVNPDVEIEPDAIAKMVECMNEHPDVGILGANLTNEPGKGLRLTDWVVGALMMIRRDALMKVGMFDEKIFLFFEETDLCKRFMAAGYKIGKLLDAHAHHDIGGSSLPSMKVLKVKAWHAAWSKAYYYDKHYSHETYMHKCWTKILTSLMRVIRYGLTFNRQRMVKALYEGRGVIAYMMGKPAFKDGVGRLT